jgi:hypothetical protein
MSLGLIDTTFRPFPRGAKHYVPVLLNRLGERDALRNVSPEQWKRLVPLMVFSARGEEAKVRADTVISWAREMADVIGQRHCFVEFRQPSVALQSVQRRGVKAAALEVFLDECRLHAIPFVPVIVPGKPKLSNVIRDIAAIDGRGVGLRLRLGDVPRSGRTRKEFLVHTLTTVDLGAEQTDLLLDLGFIAADVDLDAEVTEALIAEIAAAGSWRSIILLGSSIPPTMKCVPEGTIGSIRRKEWDLWAALRRRRKIDLPVFGDYGVQGPKDPSQKGGLGMRANIRYSANDATLVARGVGAFHEEGKHQYVGLCKKLVAHGHFAGRTFSWGDGLIDDCARERIRPGSQGMWRAAGASHHIRIVLDAIG